MIDEKFNVSRTVTCFDNRTEELVHEYDLDDFDLEAFQTHFKVLEKENPMFDCWPISSNDVNFIKSYLHRDVDWDFKLFSYFLEATSVKSTKSDT